MPLQRMTALRVLLAALALIVAIAGLAALAEVLSALTRGVLRWNYTGTGFLLGASAIWAAVSLWRFRSRLGLRDLKTQILDDGARLLAAAGGVMAGFIILCWSGCLFPREILTSGTVTYALLLPTFSFLAAAGIGFAYREALEKISVIRLALFAATIGGVIGAADLTFAGASHIFSAYHDMSLQMLVWAACCGMIAAAALFNARQAEGNPRRFARGYAGAILCGLGALPAVLWLETFLWGRNLVESWNVLIFFMPFIFIGTVALGGFVAYKGGQLYRQNFSARAEKL